MSFDSKAFREIESELDLFSLEVSDVLVWERIRVPVCKEIRQQQGEGQAHTTNEIGWRTNLRGLGLLLRNAVYRNPFFSDKHEFLFVGHQRRKLQGDGYWWDVYCDPVYEGTDIDYAHFEAPYLMSHKKPAKTDTIRYWELIEYAGKLQQELGVRRPSIPSRVKQRLQKAASRIRQRFGANLDLISRAEETLHERATTLPLYECLVERVDPSVAVLVVSYGKETFIEACQRKDVPVIELQHGVIYDQHFGYSHPESTKEMFPDYLLTFGEFWSENVQYPIADDRVIPVGYPYLEQRVDEYRGTEKEENLVFVSQGTVGEQLSKFALSVNKHPQIEHEIIYKLHPGEYDRWKNEYPWLVDSDITVIDGPDPTLYEIFAESSAQIGVGSTALYEGLCFGLETYIYNIGDTSPVEPLISEGVATRVQNVNGFSTGLNEKSGLNFDQEYFFKGESIKNIDKQLKAVKEQSSSQV